MRRTITFACVVAAAVALTGEPAAGQITHQGQDIGDHVVLRDGSLSNRDPDVCPSASFKGRGLFRCHRMGHGRPTRSRYLREDSW